MRTLLPFILVLPLVAACGRGFSDSQSDGGTTHHAGDDAGDDTDAGDDDTCGAEPVIACALPCNGGYTSPICTNGEWECPNYSAAPCPAPPPPSDGGTCGEEPPIACSGLSPCPGVYEELVCNPSGQWTCEWSGVCEDGGIIEDAEPADVWVGAPDANPPPYFSCGDLACDADTTYCQITTGGAVSPDGGVSSGYQCIPLPKSCTKGAVDCACVQALQGIGCGCVNAGDEVIVTCDIP